MNDPKYYELLDVFPNVNTTWLKSYYKQNERMIKEFSDYRWNEFSRDGGFMFLLVNLLKIDLVFLKRILGILQRHLVDSWEGG